MKKSIILLSLLLACLSATAQDTIQWGDSTYMFPSPCCNMPQGYYLGTEGGFKVGANTFLIAPESHIVYGLALAYARTSRHILEFYDWNAWVRLYNTNDARTGLEFIDSFPITKDMVDDALSRHKLIQMHLSTPESETYHSVWDTIIEIYFPQPIYVTDTFAACLRSIDGRPSNGERIINNIRCYGCECSAPWLPVYSIYDPWAYYDSYLDENYVTTRHFYGIYPIAQLPVPDSAACPAPTRPDLGEADLGRRYATIEWPGEPGTHFQVAFGSDTLSPEGNRIYDYTTRTFDTYSNLDTALHYAAWLRQECHHRCYYHDTTLWSPWSDPLVFYFGTLPDTSSTDTTTTEGILSPASPDTPISDPAYYDLLGRPVAHPKPNHLYIHNRRKIIYRPEQ